MSLDENYTPPSQAFTQRAPMHYYGDIVRVLMVAAAILVFLMEFVPPGLPYATPIIILSIVALVVAAGVTNPAQLWIHWVNVVLALIGVVAFGSLALDRYHATGASFGLILATGTSVLFLILLYFATRTLRGLMLGSAPAIR
ncbi:MAG: hypothetical protein ABA06_01525 [Parcubacteria bacterium C7867-001]|nr:MAG: hypothetical protein ABA06_01525 [Parcubacteria bacterium C7867-001]